MQEPSPKDDEEIQNSEGNYSEVCNRKRSGKGGDKSNKRWFQHDQLKIADPVRRSRFAGKRKEFFSLES